MKNAVKENNNGLKPANNNTTNINLLLHQVEHYEKERDILLALSNAITQVREKHDLVKIFLPVLSNTSILHMPLYHKKLLQILLF